MLYCGFVLWRRLCFYLWIQPSIGLDRVSIVVNAMTTCVNAIKDRHWRKWLRVHSCLLGGGVEDPAVPGSNPSRSTSTHGC